MQVLYNGSPVYSGPLRRQWLPVRAPLLPAMAALLQQDRRKRGEHRPKRLHLGRCIPFPYHFHVLHLPGPGLHFPHGDLSPLGLRLWLELHDPMYPYAPLFHPLGSEPVVDALGRARWRKHKHFTLASTYGPIEQVQEETPCGCGVRVTMRYVQRAATDPWPTAAMRAWAEGR